MGIGYLPDSFGMSSQLPHLYNGFGIRRAMFWRGCSERHGTHHTEFLWQSRDGSEVAVQVLPERMTSAAPGAAVVTTAPAGTPAPAAAPGAATVAAGAGPAQTLPPTNANLTAYLNQFYDQDRKSVV